jgi:hypothetical protein
MYLCILRFVGTICVREEVLSGRCALDGDKAGNKLRGMLRATLDLLRKAPNKLTSVNGTGAYSMEAQRLKCEHLFRYLARFGSLVVAFLLCLGVFLLPLPATGSEVPSALAMANMPRLDLETNGNGYPLEGTYVVGPGEEAEDGEKSPLKAVLLTMLLLTLCFGLSVGWLLRNAQRQGALSSLAFVHRSFATTCEDLPSLGVLRL